MGYYCTKCEKFHDDGYKRHWKYKEIETKKDIKKRLKGAEEKIRELKKKQKIMIEIIENWDNYMRWHHPYWSEKEQKKLFILTKETG